LELSAENLVKVYKKRKVVNSLSLSVSKGEIVGLLGPNGAGKSTSFYILVGIIKPEGGEVFLDGKNISKLPMSERAKSGISYLPQEASIYRKLSVEDNLRLSWQVNGLPLPEQNRRLETLLTDFGVTKRRHDMGISLSGGERRRVEIARALSTNPDFLLLDEPFTGVDPISVAEIQELVKKLKREEMGILITDHNVRDTLSIVDRAYIIVEGRILVSGTPAEIARDPKAQKFYLGEKLARELPVSLD